MAPVVAVQEEKILEEGQLPVRFQRPAYLLNETSSQGLGLETDEDIVIPVGADISSTTGPVSLRDILKRLAALKNMNISWASDVDQFALVDVDIRAEDDFFRSIDNILRQMDYFHEVQGNTIVVKYRETRKFHVAMPFMKSTYNTGVGGDVLGAGGIGGEGAGNLQGNIQLTSTENEFDIWDNIRVNLDQILGIWEETVTTPGAAAAAGTPPAQTTTTKRNVQAGKGYYTIDKPIGLITVTAPRPLVEKIAVYFDNLKKELYRQVAIEAKIVEVLIDNSEKKGINWESLLDTSLNIEMFGPSGIVYTPGTSERVVSGVTAPGSPFNVLISALEKEGPTNILANPKISVMNGQPALISIGENVRFIEKVETTVSEGTVSTSVTTNSVMSGLGMSVVATIMENDEIILSMTPVTSNLTTMGERSFSGLTVQLPTVNVREMNTLVRVKSGDMLMIGGLIDNLETNDITKVPILGDIPGLKRLFSYESKTTKKKELVILLQPKILE
ncbi:type II secretion system protein GspD [Thiovibrio sp. JS02]